jgi:hypothetical protein
VAERGSARNAGGAARKTRGVLQGGGGGELRDHNSDGGAHITQPDTHGIAPFFIVKNVPAALAFYRDRLGARITFQGSEPEDIFFGIVQRGAAMIML